VNGLPRAHLFDNVMVVHSTNWKSPGRHQGLIATLSDVTSESVTCINVLKTDLIRTRLNIKISSYNNGKIKYIDVKVPRVLLNMYYPMSKLVNIAIAHKLFGELSFSRPDACFCGSIEGTSLALELVRSYRVPCIWDKGDVLSFHYKNPLKSIIHHIETHLLRKVDGMFVTSNLQRSYYKHLLPRTPMVLVENGIFVEEYDLAYQLKSRRVKAIRCPTAIYVGSLNPLWGIYEIIEVLEKVRTCVPNFLLMVAGRGKLKQYILQKEKELKSNLFYLGYLYDAKKQFFMSLADVGLALYTHDSPAVWGVPLKIKEYLAAGVPVVSTAVGEISRFLRSCKGGLIVQHDVEEIAEAIVLLAQNDELRYKMGMSGARLVREKYDWRRIYREGLCELIEILF